MFETLGYKGLLKLLEHEAREVQFRTVIGYCDANGVRTFEGVLDCTADTEVHDMDKDVLPYERILLVDGTPISSMSRADKNKISHRAKAFRKTAGWLRANENDRKGKVRFSR